VTRCRASACCTLKAVRAKPAFYSAARCPAAALVTGWRRSLSGPSPSRRVHALPINACPFDVQLALRMAAAQQGLEAGLVDASDFDEARAGLSPEHVWAQLQALLPLSPDLVFTHGDYSLDKVLLDAAGYVTLAHRLGPPGRGQPQPGSGHLLELPGRVWRSGAAGFHAGLRHR